MKRQLTVAILALGALLWRAPASEAQPPLSGPINVTALPLPDSRCPGVTQSANPIDEYLDTEAFKCAVKLLPPSGGEIYVPAGVYRLHETISVADKSVAFRGDGKQISRLVWDGVTGDGLSFLSNCDGTVNNDGICEGLNYTLAVRSLSLLKMGAIGGAAIRGQWFADKGDHDDRGVVTATIHDVHTGTCAPPTSEPWDKCSAVSLPSHTLYWNFGIQLIRVTAAKITGFDIQGGIAGIQIAGRSEGDPSYDPNNLNDPNHGKYKSLSVQIRDGVITKVSSGIEARDWIEGLHVHSVSIREAWRGIELRGDAPNMGLGTAVSNNYILAESRGIETTNHNGVTLTNNLIERFGSADFNGIHLLNARDFRLTGNTVRSAAAGGAVGIVLDGISKENLIEGNTTVNTNVGISVVGPEVKLNVVTGNVNRNTPTPVAPGSENRVAHNH
jgi:hypothetical protein